ncbi:MAG: polysaccharide biosynthesis/export family protein [Deltaproteobacteria bacterium]|nr:polysaccharide biosynthesis/export family protein [Deltaproteobacteria bacterium]
MRGWMLGRYVRACALISLWLLSSCGFLLEPRPPAAITRETPVNTEPAEEGQAEKINLAFPVHFAKSRTDLDPQELLVLDQIAELLKRFPRVTAVVTAYQDSQRDGLSSQRQQYALRYLFAKSITRARLTTADDAGQINGERGRVDIRVGFSATDALPPPSADGELRPAHASSRPSSAGRWPHPLQDVALMPFGAEFDALAQVSPEEQSVPDSAPSFSVAPDDYLSFTEKAGYPEYKIGPNDVLELTLKTKARTLEEKYLLTVNPDGTISLPFVEPIKVGELTLREAKATIAQKLTSLYREVWIDVSIKEYLSHQVLVFGAVYQTKSLPLSKKTTLREIVALAGTSLLGTGVKPDLSRVIVRRQDGRLATVDLTISDTPAMNDFIVDARDVVFVPPAPEVVERVLVLGDVRGPGVFPLSPHMTPIEAIAKAGGYTDFAKLENTLIIRGDLSHPELITLNARQVLQGGALPAEIFLRNEDIVYIPRTTLGNVYTVVRPVIEMLRGPADVLLAILAIKQF